MRSADLHLHTTHSDGVRTPSEVIDLAIDAGLRLIAISDHDSIEAFAEISAYAQERSLTLLPGVELSAGYRGADVHLLAYGFDPGNERIGERLREFRRVRASRGEAMVDRLHEIGVPVSRERVRELCGEGAMGRPHVARALVESGAVSSVEEAFQRYLGPGCAAWVDKARFEIGEAVELIHSGGGVTSLAHPTLLPDHRRLVPEILDLGVDAIEVIHPDVDKGSRRHYESLAARRGLLMTGGSDDHGFENRKTIGRFRVPDERIAELLERIEHEAP
ncbi:MAG: PHP domain-containing protein [Thermoanaerobaculia bacterium]